MPRCRNVRTILSTSCCDFLVECLKGRPEVVAEERQRCSLETTSSRYERRRHIDMVQATFKAPSKPDQEGALCSRYDNR